MSTGALPNLEDNNCDAMRDFSMLLLHSVIVPFDRTAGGVGPKVPAKLSQHMHQAASSLLFRISYILTLRR